MEVTWLYTAVSLLLIAVAFNHIRTRRRDLLLPPSPLGLPVIGHIHLLKQPLHRTLHRLSQSLGPVFSLRFGNRLVVVVSSPAAVEECFSNHDVVLSNRPTFITGEYIGYNNTTVVTAPYGDYWRDLRRIGAIEIFSSIRLNKFLPNRRDEIQILLRKLYKISSSGDFAKVELKSKLSDLTFNIIMRMITGKRYFGEELAGLEEAKKCKEMIKEVFSYSGVRNPADFLPFLRWIDYNNLEKNLGKVSKKMDSFLQGLIEDHRNGENNGSMIDHLLSLQESEPERYTDKVIKGLIVVLILAGTDTSSVTMEWAMSLLLNHSEILKKARVEIDTHVGHDRLIDEPDLSNLPYLHNIIFETLRLFPATPLLVPRKSSDNFNIGKYTVPRETMLLVNAWAIHRDPNIWDDPESFKPERFEGKGGDVATHKLMPFGMGRRACPGSGLAQRVMGLTLGSLIQCFEWDRVSEMKIDLVEGFGVTMPKAIPLEAMCKTREITKETLLEAITS